MIGFGALCGFRQPLGVAERVPMDGAGRVCRDGIPGLDKWMPLALALALAKRTENSSHPLLKTFCLSQTPCPRTASFSKGLVWLHTVNWVPCAADKKRAFSILK